MAVFSKSGLLQQVAKLIRSAGVGGKTTAKNVRDMFTHVVDTLFHELGSINDFGPELAWDAGLTYHTTDYPFAIYGLRVFRTKVDDNRNHPPPTEPDANGIYQDAYWIEVSPAPTSGIAEWTPGVYGNGLIIVYYDSRLYRLADTVDRPFDSSDFAAEEAAGKWVAISGDTNTSISHTQNTDTKLAEGTTDEVTAAELRTLADNPPTADLEEQRLMVPISSDLDTVYGPVTMEGVIKNLRVVLLNQITGVSYQVKLNSGSNYTTLSDTVALESWVTGNVLDSASVWQLIFVTDVNGSFTQVTFQFVYQIAVQA